MEPDLEVWVFADLAEEKVQDGVRLRLGHANNAANEACRQECGQKYYENLPLEKGTYGSTYEWSFYLG